MSPAEKLAKKIKSKRRQIRARIGIIDCKVRDLRHSLGLSTQAAAQGCGMSIANFNRVERGGDVQMTSAKKLAAFFGKPIEELWP